MIFVCICFLVELVLQTEVLDCDEIRFTNHSDFCFFFLVGHILLILCMAVSFCWMLNFAVFTFGVAGYDCKNNILICLSINIFRLYYGA